MSFETIAPNVFRSLVAPEPGALGDLWQSFGADVLIAHPHTLHVATIGRQLAEGIRGAASNFSGRKVCFLVAEGNYSEDSPDDTLLEAALDGAVEALEDLTEEARELLHVVVTPYLGYRGNPVPGKGSALEFLFSEMLGSEAVLLILLDGDLRNDMSCWQGIFARFEAEHRVNFEGRPMLFSTRFAQHFLEDMLGRFLVGPLSTLAGRHLVGASSPELVLSRGAVEKLQSLEWTESRRRHGAELAILLHCLADPDVVLYEVFLGVRKCQEARQWQFRPGELERVQEVLAWLLRFQQESEGITESLGDLEQPLDPVEVRESDRTGILEGDPGGLGGFDVDAQLREVLQGFEENRVELAEFLSPEELAVLELEATELRRLIEVGEGELRFLGVDSLTWREFLYRGVARVLVCGDGVRFSRSLLYLGRLAFLDFVRERFEDLGYKTLEEIRRFQESARVEADQAGAFYQLRVDDAIRDLAIDLYDGRLRIAEHLNDLGWNAPQ